MKRIQIIMYLKDFKKMKMRQTNNTCVIEPTVPCALTVKIVFSHKVDILMHFYLDADH